MDKLLGTIPVFTIDNIESSINALRAQLAPYKLVEKLQHLEQVNTTNLYYRVFTQLAAAQCCIDEQAHSMAIAIYAHISQIAEKNSLSSWFPQLMLYLWLKYYRAVMDAHLESESDSELVKTIYQQIIALAPSYAILLNET